MFDPRSTQGVSIERVAFQVDAELVVAHSKRSRPDVLRKPERERSKSVAVGLLEGTLEKMTRKRGEASRLQIVSIRVELPPSYQHSVRIRRKHVLHILN